MPLTDAEIARILALPKRRGGGGAKNKPLVRDYDTWFKLGAKLVDENTGELTVCSNPDCIDSRQGEQKKSAVVVSVNDILMCRFCFLAGYGVEPAISVEPSTAG